MLRNRQEGLLTIHGIWILLLVSALFFFSLELFSSFNALVNSTHINLYYLAVVIGTVVSLRQYRTWAHKLGKLSLIEAFHLTKQQVLRIALVLFAMVFATKDSGMSRLFLGLFLVGASVLILLCNLSLPGLISRFLFKGSIVPTVFVGAPEDIARLLDWAEGKECLGVETHGFLSDTPSPALAARATYFGPVSALEDTLRKQPIGQVILLPNRMPQAQLQSCIDAARKIGCRVRIHTDWQREYSNPVVVDQEGDHTFLTLLDEPLENPINRTIKRLIDIAVALPIVAFILPPLTLVVYLFQRRQAPGPIFFVQPRNGITRKAFNILKYRTMYERPRDEAEQAKQATANDARIFPFGKFLRRTSLDEMPQFVNVLLGEMSVAGPRPHLARHDAEFSRLYKSYSTRHFVKPGITSLAQCKGYRGEIIDRGHLEKRIQYDIEYINRWSPLLDILIIAQTVKQVFHPPNTAY